MILRRTYRSAILELGWIPYENLWHYYRSYNRLRRYSVDYNIATYVVEGWADKAPGPPIYTGLLATRGVKQNAYKS